MLSNVKQVNGEMTSENIKCMPCDTFQSGGFSPHYGILLCQNRLRNQGHTEDTLAHELVHAYDHLRFNVDWDDLKHHACSEVCARQIWSGWVGMLGADCGGLDKSFEFEW